MDKLVGKYLQWCSKNNATIRWNGKQIMCSVKLSCSEGAYQVMTSGETIQEAISKLIVKIAKEQE